MLTKQSLEYMYRLDEIFTVETLLTNRIVQKHTQLRSVTHFVIFQQHYLPIYSHSFLYFFHPLLNRIVIVCEWTS